jgi:NSS family neurotransmitter:Na+ symporter
MTAYASYLPKDADQVNNGLVTACLNCSFEYVAGLAIFSLLFAFAIVPSAGTLSMIFFVVPQGIAAMPAAVKTFGILFFLLLMMAGLSSSISLVEGLNSAMIDKFGWRRRNTLLVTGVIGLAGSLVFALPIVMDPDLSWNGTIGLTLIDLIDHWAFSYGLLTVGLVECLLIGWMLPIGDLRRELNRNSRFHLPAAFDWLIKVVIPLALATVLGTSIYGEIANNIYGWSAERPSWERLLPFACFGFWLLSSLAVAAWFTLRPGAQDRTPVLESAVAVSTEGAEGAL